MTVDEHIAYFEQRQAEVRAFIAEQHKLMAEQREFFARDDRTLWMYPIGGMIAGATLVAAGMIFAKLLG